VNRFIERAIRVPALVLTRRLLTALLLLAVLVAPACSSGDDEVDLTSPTATRPTADAPVTTLLGGAPLAVVLGDSNTFASAPELESALADAGLTPDVRGISGSGLKDVTTDWLPAAAAVTAGQPAVTVIALGTNDAVTGADADAFAGRAEQLLAGLGQLPIIWVTHTETGGGRTPSDEKRVNDVIRSLPATHPNVTVLDLAPEIAADPAVLAGDGIHYQGDGRQWFADKVAEAASQRVQPAG
jgi:lysophospholipase L1-like esterase